jgi:GT2 family glycosyltransferase
VNEKRPLVTVAVVSWNSRLELPSCLDSMSDSELLDVWVVDNASTDGSAEFVRREFPAVSLIESGQNLGFGAAVNLVAGQTSTPWIAPANADVELTPYAVSTLLRAAASAPDVGILAPRLVGLDGATQLSVHSFPSLLHTLMAALGIHRLGGRLASQNVRVPEEGEPIDVPWAIGAFLLIRREAFKAIEGFDERHWMYGEDLEVGWAVREAGWKTVYVPDAVVRHIGGASAEAAFGDQIDEHKTLAQLQWLRRRRGRTHMWGAAMLNIFGALVRLVFLEPMGACAGERWRAWRDRVRAWLAMNIRALRTASIRADQPPRRRGRARLRP